MSSGWKEVSLEDVSENIFSGGTPSTKIPEYWNGELSWLSSGETRSTFITTTEITKVDKRLLANAKIFHVIDGKVEEE